MFLIIVIKHGLKLIFDCQVLHGVLDFNLDEIFLKSFVTLECTFRWKVVFSHFRFVLNTFRQIMFPSAHSPMQLLLSFPSIYLSTVHQCTPSPHPKCNSPFSQSALRFSCVWTRLPLFWKFMRCKFCRTTTKPQAWF